MTNSRKCLRLLAATVILTSFAFGQFKPQREYRFLFGSPEDPEIFATLGVSLNKAMQDAYFKGLGPRLPAKLRPPAETIWSAFWTFTFSLWPHEFGHWARARQLGGDFIIERYAFPFPQARMDLPDDVDPVDNLLASIGGHEINNLMMRQTHIDFFQQDAASAVDLIHAFVQEVYYPFYAFIVAPADPEDPATWLDTRGDPVESALSVFQNHTGRPPVRDDDSVDPEL
ncbi:MAG: hypothetical protein JSW54_12440, partial [Fidelibacterota bacterium]